VTARANSLKRIWSAKNRDPRLTGRGKPGSPRHATEGIVPTHYFAQKLLELVHLARRTCPTILVVALNIFR
jgi:hypothetical protein